MFKINPPENYTILNPLERKYGGYDLTYYTIMLSDFHLHPFGVLNAPYRTKEQAKAAYDQIKKANPNKSYDLMNGGFLTYSKEGYYLSTPLDKIDNNFQRAWCAQLRAEIAIHELNNAIPNLPHLDLVDLIENAANACEVATAALKTMMGYFPESCTVWLNVYAFFEQNTFLLSKKLTREKNIIKVPCTPKSLNAGVQA